MSTSFANAGGRPSAQSGAATANAVLEIERAAIRASDITTCVSEEDRAAVLDEVPDAAIEIISNAHAPVVAAPPRGGRRGLLFVGNFHHPPNADAAMHLVRDVMPLVWRELSAARLTIVGLGASSELEALAMDRVRLAGWVEDLDSELDRAVAMVAPLRYGGGVKGKVTESLSRGLPVVTTSIGSRGDGRHGR